MKPMRTFPPNSARTGRSNPGAVPADLAMASTAGRWAEMMKKA